MPLLYHRQWHSLAWLHVSSLFTRPDLSSVLDHHNHKFHRHPSLLTLRSRTSISRAFFSDKSQHGLTYSRRASPSLPPTNGQSTVNDHVQPKVFRRQQLTSVNTFGKVPPLSDTIETTAAYYFKLGHRTQQLVA